MSRTLQAHLEILPEAQRRLWPELRSTFELGLVLYGGTAIALRLRHRSSADFDFFTDRPLDRTAIHAAIPFLAWSWVLQDQSERSRLSFLAGILPTIRSRSRFSVRLGLGGSASQN